ncbi:uncharacterized protein LOC125868468 [Solanum stenotomum]|uniref:uncharacterized protein LOC125868468 n=1 Tax=Solanum stenotomum TaxID=172797 RepID=UPI0020D12CFD|nr:uncharacterized protein LOC125868468 [Solanum stenotomum]
MNEKVGPYVPPVNREAGTSMTRIEDMMQKMIKRFDAIDINVKMMCNDLSGIVQKVDAHIVSIKQLEQQFSQLKVDYRPPMLSEVERVIEKGAYEIEVSEDPEDDIEKEVEVTQKFILMPRPPPPFPQRLVKKTEEGKYRRLDDQKEGCQFKNEEKLQHCRAIATRSLVQKKKDPGVFTNRCTIGILHFAKGFCDLGASINLMPLSIYKMLGLGDPKLTAMRLLMVDRTVKRPLECSKMSL